MSSETYVIDILQEMLDNKTEEFEEISTTLHKIWNHPIDEIVVNKDKLEERRRELRGEMSALRQAIRKLSEED